LLAKPATAAICVHGSSLRLPLAAPLAPPPAQFAYKFGTTEAPRAWSKYTAGTSAHKRLTEPPKTGANDIPLGDAQHGKKGRKKKGQEPLPEEGALSLPHSTGLLVNFVCQL
jgi:hypothetical protein